jgi:hypothetical protein
MIVCSYEEHGFPLLNLWIVTIEGLNTLFCCECMVVEWLCDVQMSALLNYNIAA